MTSSKFRSHCLMNLSLCLVLLSLAECVVAQTPRGNRVLALDTGTYDGQTYSSAAADAISQGVTTTSIHLKWNQIESSPGVFAGPDATTWQNAIAAYPGCFSPRMQLSISKATVGWSR